MKRNHVSSADDTRIVWTTVGEGDDVVIYPGSLSDGSNWVGPADRMKDAFAVHVVTRRGLGESGDAPDYAIEREYEDIVAVLRATGAHRLVGHSFGGVCALGAALLHGHLDRLAVYEPPLGVEEPAVPEDALAEMEAAEERGAVDSVVETGLRRSVRLPDETVDALRAAPIWQEMVRNASTWPREMRALREKAPGVGEYASVSAPTLLLVGEETPQHHHHRTAVNALAAVIPEAHVVELAGTAHQGHLEAPDDLSAKLTAFLR